MVVIYVIVTVIVSFICTLIKVRIDQWLEDSNMNRQSRLSLRRIRYSKSHVIHDVVEISDDESFEVLPDPQKNIEQEKRTNISHEVANIPNNVADILSSECNFKHMPDTSNDSSDDEDVHDDVNDVLNVPNKSQSMFDWNKTSPSLFNWNKTSFANKPWHHNSIFPEDSISHGSRFNEEMPKQGPSKRQKLNDLTSSSDDDLIMDFNDSKKVASPPQVVIQHEMTIAGTKVKFPVKPYPCQIAVVNSLILGCTKEQNCLLESPTGSGKTLALLCGALAWQEQYSEKICQEESNEMIAGKSINAESSCCGSDNSLNDNFFLNSSQYLEEDCCDKVSRKDKARRVPKIYYATRTHKQLEQVIGEFKKTAYRHKRMTILSSRDFTCIQNTNKNKTELCNELLDPQKLNSCPYYNEKKKRDMMHFSHLNTPWDIEDLVSMGKKYAICPYFGARSLMADAEIIFCPYNYIVDPDIRESMQINLKGNVVIFDEAHNIENICREAASINLRDDDLAIAIRECLDFSQLMILQVDDRYTYSTIHEYLTDFVKFLKNINVKENSNGREMASNYWFGNEFLELLHINKIGRSRFPIFLAASKAAIQEFENIMKGESRYDKAISRETKRTLEHLCFAMQMITSDIFVNDYRVCAIEAIEPAKIMSEDGWISTKKSIVRTMKLICLNPAVIFAPLARSLHSVILASGTLAPTISFQSELGTEFRVISPNHIIPKEQVYVRCISQGPSEKTLLINHNNVNSWSCQDELGKLILQVCDAVPYGVLCFLSSYDVMNNLHNRWKSNGTWKKLLELKKIFVEPKGSQNLINVMAEYRNVIKESPSNFRIASGAILFAVFRGKIAEGIDFSDNEARCVLTIGIPFTYMNDPDVSMKMKYNDSNIISKGLLSGSDWYTVHAFRALNQALGRCVRHKNDWGAVLLVDERLQKPHYIDHLPKWIKTRCLHNKNYDLQTELEDFVSLQVARERGEKCAPVKD